MNRRIGMALPAACGVLAAAGLAVAQGAWTTVTRADLEVCRPVFAQAHRAEHAYIQTEIDRYCRQGSQDFDTQNCQFAQTWLAESRARDPVEWYFEGNGRCEGADYPCFGPGLYNDPRTGEDARRWIAHFEDAAADASTITPGMQLSDATRIGDNCIAKVWVRKYRGGSSPAPAPAPAPLAAASPPGPAPARPTLNADVASCVDGGDVTAEKIASCANVFASIASGSEDYASLAVALMQMHVDAGQRSDALRYGDLLAASLSGPEAQMTRCAVRVIVKWDLDTALAECTALGPTHAAALEARGQVHLLAGRWQEAWNDFDAAWRLGGAGQALYLRGIASAAQGRMAEALKDMADGEARAPGTAQAYDHDGYSIAAVSKGLPLAPPEAFVKAAPATQPVAAATPPPPSAMNRFDPDMRPGAMPLSPEEAKACEDDVRALQAASAGWRGTVDEISLKLAMAQRTLYATRCAGHPGAASLIAGAERVIADTGPRAALAETTPDQTAPVATDCLEPVPLGAMGVASASSVFRNTCSYPVAAMFCNVAPSSGSWAAMFACEAPGSIGLVSVPANGATAVVFGRQVNHFACRAPALPVAAYSPDSGISGFCK